MKKIFVVGVVVALGWFIASPYVTVHLMKTAIEKDDGEAFAEHVDFAALRENFKDQLQSAWLKKMGISEENASLGGMVGAGFGSILIDTMVDKYVTPAALTEIVQQVPKEKVRTTQESPDSPQYTIFSEAKPRYQGWDKFAVIFPGDDGDALKLILRRRGIGWKLTNMIVPSEVWD
ncbi:DUF2939 domain-containing protein [Pontiella sp.]|uniref:DUF2939 domain-containing protein n=1 Tax=Pontiella sp. TaxID=2837462 RepID=UPI00356A430C